MGRKSTTPLSPFGRQLYIWLVIAGYQDRAEFARAVKMTPANLARRMRVRSPLDHETTTKLATGLGLPESDIQNAARSLLDSQATDRVYRFTGESGNTPIKALPSDADVDFATRTTLKAEAPLAHDDQRLEDLRVVFKRFERVFRDLAHVNGAQKQLVENLDRFCTQQIAEADRKLLNAESGG